MKLYYDPVDLEEGLKVVWKEYIKEVKNGLAHEEKEWIKNLPNVDIEELMKLKRYYIYENEKAKSYIQKHKDSQENYLKWLTGNLDEEYKSVATQRVQEDTSKLKSATLAQIKNVLFIQYIDDAIKNNKSIRERNKVTKKRWKKSKGEFAKFVVDEYYNNQDQYASIRDAAFKIFNQYKFDDALWTQEKCYDSVRKYHSR